MENVLERDGKTYTMVEKANGVIELIPVVKDASSSPSARWRAEKSEEYYHYASDNGYNVFSSHDLGVLLDDYRHASGNYFKTKAEAEEHRDKILFVQMVKDRIRELNGGWKLNWGDISQMKHRLYFSYDYDELMIASSTLSKMTEDDKHLCDRESAEKIIQEFDEDKLRRWFI